MKTVINTSMFRKALTILAAVNFGDAKEAIYMRALRMSVKENSCNLISLNRDILVDIELPSTQNEKGDVIVDSSQIDSVLKGFKNADTTVTSTDSFVEFTGGTFARQLKFVTSGKYGVIPDFSDSTMLTKSCPSVELMNCFKLAMTAMPLSSDIVNENLRDCPVHIKADKMTISGFNSFVLAHSYIPIESEKDALFMVNQNQLSAISKILSAIKGDVSISLFKNERSSYLLIKAGDNITIALKLYEHEYPSVSSLFTGTPITRVSIPVSDLSSQLKGISGLGSASNKYPAFFIFDNNNLTIRIVTETETAVIKTPVQTAGQDVEDFKILGKVFKDAINLAEEAIIIDIYESGKILLHSKKVQVITAKIKQ